MSGIVTIVLIAAPAIFVLIKTERFWNSGYYWPGDPLFTNAPAHWGTIGDRFLKSIKRILDKTMGGVSATVKERQLFLLTSATLLGEIKKGLLQHSIEEPFITETDSLLGSEYAYAVSSCVEKLLPNGTIDIAGIVIDNGDRYGVILLDSPTPMQYINELRTLFIADGYKDLIYYAVTDPATVNEPLKIKLQPFTTASFKFDKSKQKVTDISHKSYAFWWPGKNSSFFPISAVKRDMETYLDIIDHYNSYLLTLLCKILGLHNFDARTLMPEHEDLIIKGPENVEMIMSLSKDNGIIFHFPAKQPFENYRDNFVKVFIKLCYAVRAKTLEKDVPEDTFGQQSSLLWLHELLTTIEKDPDKGLRALSMLKRW